MIVYTGPMPGRTTSSLPAWMAPADTQVTDQYTHKGKDAVLPEATREKEQVTVCMH